MDNFNLEDHNTAISAYRYILSLPSARTNPILVTEIIAQMQKHIEALSGRQPE